MVAIAPIPANEKTRLAALHSYHILDTPPDERFDLFSRLCTWLFEVPLAGINLVDSDRTFFKSLIGMQPYEPPRSTSLCAHAVGIGQPTMVIQDLSEDSRFDDHPFVTRGIRFYAGALLRSPCGHDIGTLCVADMRPRSLSEGEQHRLVELANGVSAVLELHRSSLLLLQAASRDSLTGLCNRRVFEETLESAVAAGKSGLQCALMYLDLDRFKQVNDLYGHGAGDALLREIGRRMSATARRTDVVARIAGDEFVLLMGAPSSAHGAELLAQRLLEAFSEPFEVNGQPIRIGSSIGIALCPYHAADAAGLLHCADLALYEAKRSGRGQYRMYRSTSRTPPVVAM
jgi:diguanylate cyclase (GGDEF)-like protein